MFRKYEKTCRLQTPNFNPTFVKDSNEEDEHWMTRWNNSKVNKLK